MKLVISVLLLLIGGATAQEGTGQERGLDRLEQGRNTQVVGTCTRTAAILLTCSLLGSDLAISDEVYVTNIRFGIRLCNSSLLVNLTLSNETEQLNVVDFAQCDTPVTLGQLMLAIDIAVFVDDSNLTVINTSATFNTGAGDNALFDRASIPLSEQTQTCADGVTPPPDPGSCNPTTFKTVVSTTTMTPQTTSQSMPTFASVTIFYVLLITVASALTLL